MMEIIKSIKKALRAIRNYRLKAPFVSQLMIARYEQQALLQVFIDRITMTTIQKNNFVPFHRIFYLSFGRQVGRVFRKQQGSGIGQELNRIRNKWLKYGLDPKLLVLIEKQVIAGLSSANPFWFREQ